MDETKEQILRGLMQIVVDGLTCDGAHHKQWYLDTILTSLCEYLNVDKKAIYTQIGGWERGIAP